MGTVTVDGAPYEVYGDLAGATAYIAGLMTPAGVAWRTNIPVPSGSTAANERQRTLLQARLFLDRQPWQGTATAAGTTLAWPRTNVLDRNGVAVSSTVVPPQVVQAAYELAALFATTPAAYSDQSTGSNVRSVKAGPASVEFFHATTSTATYFPKQVDDLVAQFLGSAASSVAGKATGTSCESEFTDCMQSTRTAPW